MFKNTLTEAIRAGAAELIKYFNGEFKVSEKEGINNLVTEADHASEKAILEVIKRDFPDHAVLGEESGSNAAHSEYEWIIDPIDGTVNFAHGIPLCCVSVGLYKNREALMGAVYNPLINEFYFAEKDKGATLNDRPIHVSKQPDLVKACLVTGFPYNYPADRHDPITIFSKLVKQGIPVRRLGSAAIDLCWVAAGRFDGFYEHNLSAWDTAAGFLIVQEAGGKITNFNGEQFHPDMKQIIATNGRIHDALMETIVSDQNA